MEEVLEAISNLNSKVESIGAKLDSKFENQSANLESKIDSLGSRI